MHNTWFKASLLLLPIYSASVQSAEFSSCPTQAFIVQKSTAELYGVNLATGSYEVLSSDMGTSSKINGMGFNVFDNYLYGWFYEEGTLARIGDDYQAEALEISGDFSGNYYVGDVGLHENKYYFFRPGFSHGLYSIPLDPSDPNYLVASRIIDGGSNGLPIRIFDIAFHPTDSYLYAVDKNGNLYKIDSGDGSYTQLSNIGQTGVFGAVYFDASGNFYISRNSDGNVFRIDVSASSPTAELFAYGPSSNTNDGARCATAPVEISDSVSVDFGDAPDTYGTSLNNNGARHEFVDGGLHLGASIDAETAALVSPQSDDSTDGSDDEDGVTFKTGLEVGIDARVEISASAQGYLNAWYDWDLNGVFEDDEKVFSDVELSAGVNSLDYTVPVWASAGSTWARFRFSSTQGIAATGGVSDGEVEDYAINVTQLGVSSTHYPSENDWVTIAYEDNWPDIGDYDLNDLVMYYRTTTYDVSEDSTAVGVRIQGQITAMGASQHNGLAVNLPGILSSQINESSIRYLINDELQSTSPVESNRDEAILILTDDVRDYVSVPNGCKFYRTEDNCDAAIEFTFDLSLSFNSPVAEANMPSSQVFDPFLFASDNYWRGTHFNSYPGRSMEIHLKNYAATSAFDAAYYGLGDDNSAAGSELYFLTETGMPWAIEVGTSWKHPNEYIDIQNAYPDFTNFVTSGGTSNTDWYLESNANMNNVFNP